MKNTRIFSYIDILFISILLAMISDGKTDIELFIKTDSYSSGIKLNIE